MVDRQMIDVDRETDGRQIDNILLDWSRLIYLSTYNIYLSFLLVLFLWPALTQTGDLSIMSVGPENPASLLLPD